MVVALLNRLVKRHMAHVIGHATIKRIAMRRRDNYLINVALPFLLFRYNCARLLSLLENYSKTEINDEVIST